MTRIIAGAAKGRTLLVPPGEGTRPTSDRAREALFSRLEHDGWVEGSRVLDLYAGTGALGLEAASRGAAAVLLVERAQPAVRAARRNAHALAAAGATSVEVRAGPVTTVLAAGLEAVGAARPFDLVLADPPYDVDEVELGGVLDALTRGWLARDALVVVERGRRSPQPRWPAVLEPLDVRRYGEAALWSARTAEAASGPGEAGPDVDPQRAGA